MKQGRDGGRDARQGRVRLGHNAFRHVVRQKWSLSCVDVRMQEDLRASVSSVSHICSKALYIYMSSEHTWFAAGLILADASRIVRSSIPKLLTPMLLRRCARQFNIIPKLFGTEPAKEGRDQSTAHASCCLLGETSSLYGFHLCPSRWNVRPREIWMMDKIQIDVFDAELYHV